MPVLGRLFSNHNTTNARTEIMLLITPRLIRNLVRPDASVIEFAAGTEASASGGPLGGVSGSVPQPFVQAPAAFTPPAPPVQPAAPVSSSGGTPIGAPGGAPIVPFGGVESQ
jgi:general secretion pathway protein D